MKCASCGASVTGNVPHCPVCGSLVTPPAQANSQPNTAEVKLLGPWAYFGLQLLFSIPLVGFILLIVFSFDNRNLNRRNYARSYWCSLILALVISIITVIILATTGAFETLASSL